MIQISLRRDEAAYLAAYLRRLAAWDPRAAVRVQVAGRALGVFGAPPMDCLTFVAVPLADPIPPGGLDRVVSAGRLRDVLGEVSAERWGDVRSVTVPDEIGPFADLTVLPPRGPWTPAERGIAGDVRPLVDAAVAEFRSRSADPLTSGDELAERAWSRSGWGGVPMRALHAAALIGLMPHDGLRVETATCEGWKRFSSPGGQVFVRTSGLPPRLTLASSSGSA